MWQKKTILLRKISNEERRGKLPAYNVHKDVGVLQQQFYFKKPSLISIKSVRPIKRNFDRYKIYTLPP